MIRSLSLSYIKTSLSIKVMMDYCYDVVQGDSFYADSKFHYSFYNDKIIGIEMIYDNYSISGLQISTFDCDTKIFTATEVLHEVSYKDFKHVSCYLVDLVYLILIDVENKQYAKGNPFPFMISEIDGNCVEACHNDDTIFIFHSETDGYETGVFIFDIKNNQLNYSDYWEDFSVITKYTNKFANLHNKTITSCNVHNNIIYVLWHDNDDEELKLSTYDPVNDQFTNILLPIPTETWYKDLIVVNNKAYIRGNNLLCIYDIKSHELLEKKELFNKIGNICYFWMATDQYIAFIVKNYQDSHATQIHKIQHGHNQVKYCANDQN